jgi:CDP-2,3-bis-(O-geranylgeranyl)-sn-glycerol synthase
MIDLFLGALWFFVPAGIANMVPVLAAKIPVLDQWNARLDFGKTFNDQPLFGANKTWRGLVAGVVAATLIVALQKYLYSQKGFFFDISWADYSKPATWWLGPLFGAGALIADSVESFFKRQKHVAPGKSWFPYDQIDYIIGGIIFTMPIMLLSVKQYLWIFIVWFGMHLLFSYIAYLLGLKKHPI